MYPEIGLDVDPRGAAADGADPRRRRPAALRGAADFRQDRIELQREQVARLDAQLPLPQLHLPFVFTAEPRTPADARRSSAVAADGRHRRSAADDATRRSATLRRRALASSICCGSGGVGQDHDGRRASALEGARHGRRAVVVTIDPAKRLADALGLAGGLTNDADADRRDRGRDELWAVMLDTKTHLRRRSCSRYSVDPRPRRDAHPGQPLLPQHLGRAVGHAGVHGGGEALRAARRTATSTSSSSTRRRRATPSTSSTRPAARPLPRPPPLPHA